MNKWLAPLAAAALFAVAACTGATDEAGAPTAEVAARNSCLTQAEAAHYSPEGRRLVGAADSDRYVAECMRTKRRTPR